MALAWFVCIYDVMQSPKTGFMSMRACGMDRFTAQIYADGGNWSEVEVLGSYALVKVNASTTTLNTISNTNGFYKVTDHFVLDDSLADLTNPQKNAIEGVMLDMGYLQSEIDATMGDTLALWRQKSLSTLLNFIASRRILPRWDAINNQLAFDGPPVKCGKTVAKVDSEVT